MLLVAMLAVGLVVAAPAMAQVGQGFSESRDKSGTATPKVEVKNTGNNANLCAQLQQAVQTGQVLNEQGVTQYVSNADDIDLTGSEIGLTPSETAECTQQIQQSSAAGPKAEAKAGKAEAKAVLLRPRQARQRPRRFRRPAALIVSRCWGLEVLLYCWAVGCWLVR